MRPTLEVTMKLLTLLSVAAGLALSSFAPQALAQSHDRVVLYHFDDDDLIGEAMGGTPPLLRVRTTLPRVMLLRPRASFVPELLKSVEDS